jgi:hypothetical protein
MQLSFLENFECANFKKVFPKDELKNNLIIIADLFCKFIKAL